VSTGPVRLGSYAAATRSDSFGLTGSLLGGTHKFEAYSYGALTHAQSKAASA
jgi:hypothetical protein